MTTRIHDLYTQYVHEFTDAKGVKRFAVALWDHARGQYIVPCTKRQHKLTGCSYEYANKLELLGGDLTRKQALRRARYIFKQ
jgi:hypothetical protein